MKRNVICLLLGIVLGTTLFATPKKFAAYPMEWQTENSNDIATMWTVQNFLGNDYEIVETIRGFNGFTKNFTDWTTWNVIYQDLQKLNDTTKPQNLFLYNVQLGAPTYLVIANNYDGKNCNIIVLKLKKTKNTKITKISKTKDIADDVEGSAKTTKVASSRASDVKEDFEWEEE